jgi:WD40 repeat protein
MKTREATILSTTDCELVSDPQGVVIEMQDRQTEYNNQSRRRRLGIMAAVIFLIALVGSMVIVFRSVRHYDEARASACTHNETTTVQPTQPAIHQSKSLGKIVYSTPICPIDGSYIFAPLTWSPDSKRLGVGTLSAQSWFATTGQDVVSYGPNRNASILAVVWSPDGQRFAVTAVSQGVQIFDASTGHLLKTYPDNSQASTVSTTSGYMSLKLPLSGGSGAGATSWSPDGKLMATAFFGSYGRSVQVWNTSRGKLVLNYTGHADGQYVASSSADGSTQVWNALTGQKTYDFESKQRGGDDVAWSPHGKTIAYFARNQVRVVNPFTGKILVTHISPDDILVWSPDGKSIASAGDHIELWSVATGKTYYTFTKNSPVIRTLAWSPDGNYIASDNFPAPYFNSTIQVWIAE